MPACRPGQGLGRHWSPPDAFSARPGRGCRYPGAAGDVRRRDVRTAARPRDPFADGKRYAYDTAAYDETEIARIAHAGFQLARSRRRGKLWSPPTRPTSWSPMFSGAKWSRRSSARLSRCPTNPYVRRQLRLSDGPQSWRSSTWCWAAHLIGDFLSDLAAIVSGGLRHAAFGLPLRSAGSGAAPCRGIYEPVHGYGARDCRHRQGQSDRYDPLGRDDAAPYGLRASRPRSEKLDAAVGAGPGNVGIATPDIGGTATTTQEVRDAVIRRTAGMSADPGRVFRLRHRRCRARRAASWPRAWPKTRRRRFCWWRPAAAAAASSPSCRPVTASSMEIPKYDWGLRELAASGPQRPVAALLPPR